MKAEKLLELMGNIPDAYIMEAMERPARRLHVGKLLLAAALMLVGVTAAVAGFQSRLLGHIFRNSAEPPTPAVEAHLVQLDETAEPEAEDISFRVDEYLLDDDKLYLTWTAENHTGKPLIFYGPIIKGEGEFEIRTGMIRTALGGEVLGAALPETGGETTEFRVIGGGEGPVTVTMLAQEPIAPFVDDNVSSPVGTPVIAWDVAQQQVESFCYGISVGQASKNRVKSAPEEPSEDEEDLFAGPWISRHYSYDDREALWGDFADKSLYDSMLGETELDEKLGYARLAKRWDVELTLEKGAARRTLAAELPRFDFKDFTLVVTEFTQTDVTNRLRFQAVPKREGVFDDGVPQLGIYVNGATEEPRSITGWGYILKDGWEIDGVTPVEDAPAIAAEEIEWLNDGETIREIRLETEDGEGIDWKL